LVVVIEIKSALTKAEWKKAAQIKEDYNKLDNPPNYWLLAIRADGLDSGLHSYRRRRLLLCAFKAGRKIFELPEHDLKSGSPWNRG
jgi:hypothetical protein